QSHFIATRPIHAAHKPTAATRPQIEPPPICFWIAHPAQGECDGSTSARKSTSPARVAAQVMAPILMTFPQDRWSKLVEVLIFGGWAVFERHREPSYDALLTRHHTTAITTNRCRGLVVRSGSGVPLPTALSTRQKSTAATEAQPVPEGDIWE